MEVVVGLVLAIGWFGNIACLVDAIRRRVQGREDMLTWVVVHVVCVLAFPLAWLAVSAYLIGVVRPTRRTAPRALTSGVASRGRRLGAALLDFVIVGVPLGLLTWAVSDIDLDDRVFDSPAWLPWLGWSANVMYAVLPTTYFGQTGGKALVRIQVVDVPTGQPPSLRGAAIRALSQWSNVPLIAATWVSWVVYLPILWRDDRRGWHDQLAGTAVVTVGS